LITDAAAGRVDGFISANNVGEIYYITARKKGDVKAEATLHALQHFPRKLLNRIIIFVLLLLRLKQHMKCLTQTHLPLLTKEKKGLLITGDSEFKNLKGIQVKLIR
jgi:hypothetical protein